MQQPDANKTPVIGSQIQIQNVQLETFERAVYSRDHENASGLMLGALRSLKQGAGFVGHKKDPRVLVPLYTRFCAAVVSLLADPKYALTNDGFGFLAAEHAILDLVFRASAFGSSDHLLAIVSDGVTEADGKPGFRVSDGMQLVKFLMTHSLRSGFNMNVRETFQKNPQAMLALWAGMISPLLTVSKDASARREALLGMHEVFKDAAAGPTNLLTLSDAYMYTSYGLREDKHAPKATIHRAMARMLKMAGVEGPSRGQLKVSRSADLSKSRAGLKPTLLICLDWFNCLHAMYRCYAPAIRQLKRDFRLVGMSRAVDIDDVGKAEFDEWVEVPADGLVLQGLVASIERIRPAMIYYPSLGMAAWWVACASLRLAPIQLMTLGHPASSQSPEMDYVLLEDGALGEDSARLFTEKVVVLPSASCRFEMRRDAVLPKVEAVREPKPTVDFAVPAMLCKLNPLFLETLAAARNRCLELGQPVAFHFFVNMMGVNLHQSAKEIREWIPDALTYERSDYNDYMGHIARCDAHLCTFPFGGTNSTIDSMMLGLPVLSLQGPQPHERFDGMLTRRAGLPEWLVAKSREEYADALVCLATEHDRRQELREHLLAFDLQRAFYGEPEPDRRTAFADAFKAVFLEHEAFQKSRDRVFNIGARP
jgi:HMW1C N-terminal